MEQQDAGALPPGTPPAGALPQPSTGNPRVDEAVGRLSELAGLPVTEHPAVFAHVHRQLAEALGELDPPAAGR